MDTFEDEWEEGAENVTGGWGTASRAQEYGQQSSGYSARGDSGFSRSNDNFGRGGRDNSQSHGGFDRQDKGYSQSRGGFDRQENGYNQSRGGFDRSDSRGGFDHGSFSRGGQDRDSTSRRGQGFDRNDSSFSRGGQGSDFGRGGFNSREGGFRNRDSSGQGRNSRDGDSGFGRGGFNGGRRGSNDGYSPRGGGLDSDRGRSGFSRSEGFGGSGFGRRNNDEEEGFSSMKSGFGDNEESGFRGRGRGGRGGGRGGFNNGGLRRGFGNQDDDSDNGNGFRSREGGRGGGSGGGRMGEDGEERPREIYIPPEDTNDENEIYASGISTGINFDKYDKIDVKVTGSDVPQSMTSFESCGLREALVQNVKRAGYKTPTPVQKRAIPIIMAGRDLMACAQTGSGKTAAFLLPMLHSMMANNLAAEVSPDGAVLPYAIILSPTRELAKQIYNEARKFSLHTILKCAVVYGGTQVRSQIDKIAQGVHVLVATPGRLDDLTNRGRISYANVKYVVLDEADRMLDMGFLPAIEKFLNNTTMQPPGERVTLMFSATFPNEVQQLASKFLADYLFLAVGIVGGACSDVEQTFHQVGRFEKRKRLEEMLMEHNEVKSMVFVETKRTADFIATYLSDKGLPTTSIHGDRFQRQREEALLTFTCGTMKVLVATAVAARGLDIKGVEHVINYDLPKSIDEYVHRIGRTGRVGNCGKATSFYDSEVDRELAPHLLRILVGAEQNVPEWLQQDASGGAMSNFGRSDFGGSDVRKFGGGGVTEHFSAPAPVEPEDSWD